MFYKRLILGKLNKYLEYPEALVITGMRRVGKTSILRHLFDNIKSSNKAFYDFGSPLHRQKFEKIDYDGILDGLAKDGISKKERAYIFIDEIQNLPQISSVIKYLIDHYQTKFFVTGSSSYYIKNLFPESLAGRKFIFEVFPLTFSEFLEFKNKRTNLGRKDIVIYNEYSGLYNEYVAFGGFPEVVLEQDIATKENRLDGIFTSYFENDVKTLADFRDASVLRDLIILLANQTGSKTDISKLASATGVSRNTIYSHLTFLEETYFIKLLPQFSRNYFRQAAGSKKVYFCDSGLANFLAKPSQGQLFEQSIFQNLRINHELAYFDKGGGSEIDFIVDKKMAIEAKVTAGKRDVANLERRSKMIDINNYKVATLYYSEEKHTIPALSLLE